MSAFLLISMQRYSRKKWRMAGFEVEKGELGEKPAVFSNGEKRRENVWRSVRNGLFSLLRRGDGRKRRICTIAVFHDSCGKRNSPLTGKPSMGCVKSDGRVIIFICTAKKWPPTLSLPTHMETSIWILRIITRFRTASYYHRP